MFAIAFTTFDIPDADLLTSRINDKGAVASDFFPLMAFLTAFFDRPAES